jgi:hypothetical protein
MRGLVKSITIVLLAYLSMAVGFAEFHSMQPLSSSHAISDNRGFNNTGLCIHVGNSVQGGLI